jgi:hypothetical protein
MTKTLTPPKLLYDHDFLQWTEETIAHLQNRDFNQLDIGNLIEEIDSLGKSQKNAFKGQIRALIGHIMKRCYVDDMPLEYKGWERTIRNIRPEIEDLIYALEGASSNIKNSSETTTNEKIVSKFTSVSIQF